MNRKDHLLLLALLGGVAVATAIHAADGAAVADSAASHAREAAHEAKDGAKEAARETGEFMTDAGIATKVKAALLSEKNLKSLGIDVDAKDGTVTLRGSVATAAEIKQAEDVARSVKGVKSVRNDLHLKTAKND